MFGVDARRCAMCRLTAGSPKSDRSIAAFPTHGQREELAEPHCTGRFQQFPTWLTNEVRFVCSVLNPFQTDQARR